MKELFDNVSTECCKLITKTYSTSFSMGIKFLAKKFHQPVYSIYGFVRLADEIVDSFHDFDKPALLDKFKRDTYEAISTGISTNPVLNSFQHVVNKFHIEHELIDTFLTSMEMDITNTVYKKHQYEQYILGSAESVGLMCLRVFCEGNSPLYDSLKNSAMKLGAAFQKVNFLRDLKADNELLNRTYFPGVNYQSFHNENKNDIEVEIENDFVEALLGIRRLPSSSRAGVYLSYYYYKALFRKIKSLPADRIKTERIRIPDAYKILLLFKCRVRHQLNLL